MTRGSGAVVFREKSEGNYAFSGTFWTYAVIASIFIVWIGVRTQQTANQSERLAQETTAFAEQTQDCLDKVLVTLKERVGFSNEDRDLDERRQDLLEGIVFKLSQIGPKDVAVRDGEAQVIINDFVTDIEEINIEKEEVRALRESTPYPDPTCGQEIPGR